MPRRGAPGSHATRGSATRGSAATLEDEDYEPEEGSIQSSNGVSSGRKRKEVQRFEAGSSTEDSKQLRAQMSDGPQRPDLEEVGDEEEDFELGDDEEEMLGARKSQRQRRRKPVFDDDDDDDGERQPLSKSLLHSVISQVRQRDEYGIFHLPIDKDDLPQYYDIILEPIDMQTMDEQVDDGTISTVKVRYPLRPHRHSLAIIVESVTGSGEGV